MKGKKKLYIVFTFLLVSWFLYVFFYAFLKDDDVIKFDYNNIDEIEDYAVKGTSADRNLEINKNSNLSEEKPNEIVEYENGKIVYIKDFVLKTEGLYFFENKKKYSIIEMKLSLSETNPFLSDDAKPWWVDGFIDDEDRFLLYHTNGMVATPNVYDSLLKKTVDKRFLGHIESLYSYNGMLITCTRSSLDGFGSGITVNVLPDIQTDFLIFPFNFNSDSYGEYENNLIKIAGNQDNYDLEECTLNDSILNYEIYMVKGVDYSDRKLIMHSFNLDGITYTDNYLVMKNILFNRNDGTIRVDLSKLSNFDKYFGDNNTSLTLEEERGDVLLFKIEGEFYNLDIKNIDSGFKFPL